MANGDLFVDRLPDDALYDGIMATAYDTFMPPGTRFADDAVHRAVLRRADGPCLELATGTGRFLIPALEAGLQVEGIDSSADMLDRCRRHAAVRGVDAVLHHGDIAPLAVGPLTDRVFAALVCPASSFTLVTDPARAAVALRTYHDHLAPGGELAITMFTAGPKDTTRFLWRLRRTGTDADTGLTYVVHESTGDDSAPQTQLVYNRLETYDADGRLLDTVLRKMRLRWWHRQEFTDALETAGFGDVELLGDEHGWIALARRP